MGGSESLGSPTRLAHRPSSCFVASLDRSSLRGGRRCRRERAWGVLLAMLVGLAPNRLHCRWSGGWQTLHNYHSWSVEYSASESNLSKSTTRISNCYRAVRKNLRECALRPETKGHIIRNGGKISGVRGLELHLNQSPFQLQVFWSNRSGSRQFTK